MVVMVLLLLTVLLQGMGSQPDMERQRTDLHLDMEMHLGMLGMEPPPMACNPVTEPPLPMELHLAIRHHECSIDK